MPELDPSVDRALAQARRAYIDRDFSFSLLGSLSFHLLFLLASWLMPPVASGLSIDMNADDQRYARYLIERPEPELPAFLGASERGEKGAEKPASGAAGQAGAPDASAVRKKRATRGDGKLAGQVSPSAQTVGSVGILGVLEGSVPQDLGGLFGPHATGGEDARTFLGALYGEELGDSFGFGGLGLRDKGRGGGGDATGTIGLEGLDTRGVGTGGRYGTGVGGFRRRGEGARPGPIGGPVVVAGGLSKETIRRTIYPHLAEIRFCYEEGRRAQPELAGRVTVGFLIGPSGAVQSVRIAQSDLAPSITEQCIQNAVRRWAFPQPENGGLVSVTYPFLLQASE